MAWLTARASRQGAGDDARHCGPDRCHQGQDLTFRDCKSIELENQYPREILLFPINSDGIRLVTAFMPRSRL